MAIPELSFPLRVDFGRGVFWIEDEGPYVTGEAVTEFLDYNLFGQDDTEMLHALWHELAQLLAVHGVAMHPYAPGGFFPLEIDAAIFNEPELGAVTCSICIAQQCSDGEHMEPVERYVFQSLRDFLYIELIKAIGIGNAPRMCRCCKRWFLHRNGEKFVYCTRVAPGEEAKTCREVGALATFEDKVAENDVWKLYKRAYKKYYARFMKGRMSRQELDAWTVIAIALREDTMELWTSAETQEEKDAILERYRGQLNAYKSKRG